MTAGSATKRGQVVLVVTRDGTMPGWAPEMEGLVVVDEGRDDRALASLVESVGAAAIDARVRAPFDLARRIRRLAPGIQLVFVAPADRSAELRREMRFSRGLGEPWIVDPGGATRDLLERASRIARQRESHVRRLEWLSERVASIKADAGRPLMSDQYLATLLELLPDPVFALDEERRVLFANSAAETLGVGRAGESRHPFRLPGAIPLGDDEDLDALLSRGAEEPATGQIAVRGASGERVYDVSVAPVAGERPVRLLLLHDVTERAHLLEERDRAVADLEEAMRHRSRFYTSMSHELRTPINALIGYNNLLLEGIYGDLPSDQREALERLGRSARHLMDLVDDVLDLSKVEAGKLEMERAEVSVPALLDDLEATTEHLSRSSGSGVRFRLDPSCGTVRSDPKRLRQILMNLLSNAIRYGGGAPVEVRCRSGGDDLVVEVEDHGPGIPADDLERIFDEFVQLGDEEDGGTGLGLPISRTLARLLGGDVTVESEIGRGSTFTLTVPRDGGEGPRDGGEGPRDGGEGPRDGGDAPATDVQPPG